jgi:hypothetical protein
MGRNSGRELAKFSRVPYADAELAAAYEQPIGSCWGPAQSSCDSLALPGCCVASGSGSRALNTEPAQLTKLSTPASRLSIHPGEAGNESPSARAPPAKTSISITKSKRPHLLNIVIHLSGQISASRWLKVSHATEVSDRWGKSMPLGLRL